MRAVSHPLKMKLLSSTLIVLLGLYLLSLMNQYMSLRGLKSHKNHASAFLKKSVKRMIRGVHQAKAQLQVLAPEPEEEISIPSLQKKSSYMSSKRLTKAASYPTLNAYLGQEVLNITRVNQKPSKSEDIFSLQDRKQETRYMRHSQGSEKSSYDPSYTSLKNREL
jgi:hypothetical protein